MQAPRLTASLWGQLVLLSVLWGGSFALMKVVVTDLPPLTTVAGRMVLSTLLLLPLLRLVGAPVPRGRAVWLLGLGLGTVVNVVPFTLIGWSQQTIGPGLAAIINATTPLFVVAAAPFFFADERLTVARVGGILLGLAGVVVLIGPAALRGTTGDMLPLLAGVLAAMFYAAAGIWTRRSAGRHNVWTLNFVTCAGGAVVAGVLALAVDQPWQYRPAPTTLLALLLLAGVATVGAYFLYYNVLRGGGATAGALTTQVVPFSAALFGVLLFDERIGINAALGFMLIALGFALVDGRVLRLFRRQETGRAPPQGG